MSAMAGNYAVLIAIVIASLSACSSERQEEPKQPLSSAIVVSKRPVLSQEQRSELGFPADVIAKVELAAGADAEPFFVSVVVRTENLKGEKGFRERETGRLQCPHEKGRGTYYLVPGRASCQGIRDLQKP